jgi:hypothetical protein
VIKYRRLMFGHVVCMRDVKIARFELEEDCKGVVLFEAH